MTRLAHPARFAALLAASVLVVGASPAPPLQPPTQQWARIEAGLKPLCLTHDVTLTEGAPKHPPIAWNKLSVLENPSAAQRHHAQDCAATPLATPVSVALVCMIDVAASTGPGEDTGMWNCHPEQPVQQEALTAARSIADGYRIAPIRQRDDADYRQVRLTVVVDPADRRPLVRDRSLSVLTPGEVTWLKPIGSVRWADHYPARAVRLERQASLTILCQIQPDGGLICSDMAIRPAEYGEFEAVAEAVEANVQAGPTLTDGSPSAGRWVILLMRFSPPA